MASPVPVKLILTLKTPIPQNVQEYLNNFRQQPANCLSVFDHFAKLALKGLTEITSQRLSGVGIWRKKPLNLVTTFRFSDVFRGLEKGCIENEWVNFYPPCNPRKTIAFIMI